MSINNFFSDPTLLVITIFLIITFVVGIYSGRNSNTLNDYILANKSFTSGMLVLSFLATNFGGDILGDAEAVYNDGIIVLCAFVFLTISLIFTAIYIAPKIVKFKNILTSGDLMQTFYGENAKIIYGIFGTINCITRTAMQLIVFKIVCKYLLNINPEIGIIVAGFILTIYSSFGGIRAVTITDILHFLVILIVFPLIISLVVKNVGGLKNLFTNLPKEKYMVLSHKKSIYYFVLLIVWCALPGIPLACPDLAQRLYMSKSAKQIKNQYLIIAAIDPAFRIVVTLIGLVAIVKFPGIKPSLAMPEVLNNFLTPSIRIAAIVSIFSLIISSADSTLHASGVAISYDVLSPLLKKFNIKINTLLMIKVTTFFTGILSIIIALKFNNILEIGFFAAGLLFPVTCIPLVAGVLGLKTKRKAFYISFVCTIISYICSYFFIQPQYLNPLISLLTNVITFTIANIILNKGIIINQRNNGSDAMTEKSFNISIINLCKYIASIIPTPKKIFYFSKSNVMKYGANNIVFGVFCCINFTLPYFMWEHQSQIKYDLIIYLRFIGGILAGLCIVKDQWKEFFKKYFHLFWHFTLVFCLPFITTVMFFITNGSFTWLFNIGIAIFFLILLVDGSMFLILAPLGVILGILFYKWQVGPLSMLSFGFDINYHLIYQIIFPTVIGLLFAFRKKFFFLVRGNQGINLGLTLCHELRNTGLLALPTTQILNKKMMNICKSENTDDKSFKISKSTLKSLINISSEVEALSKNTIKVVNEFESIFMEFRHSIANPGMYSMSSIVNFTVYQYHFFERQLNKIQINIIDDFYAKVPKSALSFALSNIIRNAFKHGRASLVKVILNNNKIHIRDNGFGIEQSKLTEIYKLFYSTGDETNRGVGLAFVKQLVESFFGKIYCESEQGKNSFTEFTIEFPAISGSDVSNINLIEVKEEAEKEGEKKLALTIARKMLQKGIEIGNIQEYTKLSLPQINQINEDIEQGKKNKQKNTKK